MVIDKSKNTRKLITLPHELLARIAAFQASSRIGNKLPTESAAIRMLIERGLAAFESGDSQAG